MTSEQEKELSMFKAVQKVLNDNAAIVSSGETFQIAKKDFDNALENIENARLNQLKNIIGNSSDKEDAATAAINAATALIGPARSFATATNNNTLYRVFNCNTFSLRKQRDKELVNSLSILRDNLQENVSDLSRYNITPAKVMHFTSLIGTYKTLISATPNLSAKSAATKEMKEGFTNTKAILSKRIDSLVNKQKTINPDFYTAYKNARGAVADKAKTTKKKLAKAA